MRLLVLFWVLFLVVMTTVLITIRFGDPRIAFVIALGCAIFLPIYAWWASGNRSQTKST